MHTLLLTCFSSSRRRSLDSAWCVALVPASSQAHTFLAVMAANFSLLHISVRRLSLYLLLTCSEEKARWSTAAAGRAGDSLHRL